MAFLWENPAPKNGSGIPNYNFPTTKKLEDWGDERLTRKNKQSDLDFLAQVNRSINSATYNCAPTDSARLIEKFLTIIKPKYFAEEGLLTPKYFHCGFCSQRAYITAKALEIGGIEAMPFGLNGHVVVRARINGVYWIIDPDIGIGPIKYEEINSKETKLIYKEIAKNHPIWLKSIYKAIDSQSDDAPYTPMNRLDTLSDLQEKYISRFELFFYTIGALGTIMIAVSFAMLYRKFSQNKLHSLRN